ncbi:MAG TPA: ribosome biogenesis GTPase Der [Pirellulaceae bacterium]|nr:ribosome biogenesis GTPase Der [Pirellulaceae bacterium]
MAVPQVVIVGRPNVGKSSLLNWLAGKRISIVDDQAGVTRDRVTHLMEHNGRYFELVDTGGIGIADVDNLTKEIEQQIDAALDAADVILFVVDTRTGTVSLDNDIAKRLRYIEKPIVCVANKTDDERMEPQADEFYKFGLKLLKVSTLQNRGKDDLLGEIYRKIPRNVMFEKLPEEPAMKVAIVGRRNVGKSTFVNTLAKAERMIVSEVPGTTRDSVDVQFELDGKTFVAIDTAGVRRHKSIRTDIDFYSFHRAQRSIRRADIVLLFFDCTQRLSKVDKQLCKYIADQYKACIFVVNKWDLLYGQMPTERWVDYLRDSFPTMWHVPIAFITGQTGKNVKALLNHAQMLFKQSLQRVATSELNRLVRAALTKHPPPMHGILRPKIYYATQVSIQPPTMVLICNEPKAFQPNYRRYLLSILRDNLSFGEVPIKMYLQKRRPSDKRDDLEAGEDTPAELAAMEVEFGEEEDEEDTQLEDSEIE